MEPSNPNRKIGPFLWLSLTLAILSCCGCGSPSGSVRLAVGGQAALRFFPVYLAQAIGAYKAEGLTVTIDGFPGSARALQALEGGSADVAAGFYDQTQTIQAEGRTVTSFFVLTKYLGFVVVASPKTSNPIDSIAALKGAKIGVAAPGSSGHILLNGLLARQGLNPEDVSIVSIGTGGQSITALERGLVDAAVVADLVVVALKRNHPDLKILVDTRTPEGLRQSLGASDYPGSVLYADPKWLASHDKEAQALARAMKRTMEWVRSHTPKEVAAKLKDVYATEDATILEEALSTTIAILSPDGRMQPGAPETVRQALSQSNEKIRSTILPIENTFTNRFVDRIE